MWSWTWSLFTQSSWFLRTAHVWSWKALLGQSARSKSLVNNPSVVSCGCCSYGTSWWMVELLHWGYYTLDVTQDYQDGKEDLLLPGENMNSKAHQGEVLGSPKTDPGWQFPDGTVTLVCRSQQVTFANAEKETTIFYFSGFFYREHGPIFNLCEVGHSWPWDGHRFLVVSCENLPSNGSLVIRVHVCYHWLAISERIEVTVSCHGVLVIHGMARGLWLPSLTGSAPLTPTKSQAWCSSSSASTFHVHPAALACSDFQASAAGFSDISVHKNWKQLLKMQILASTPGTLWGRDGEFSF